MSEDNIFKQIIDAQKEIIETYKYAYELEKELRLKDNDKYIKKQTIREQIELIYGDYVERNFPEFWKLLEE